MKKTRILLADDHVITRMGLNMLFSSEPDMEVVGEADNGEAAVRLAQELRPDIVIMDLMMPKVDGAEATRRIRADDPDVRIVILTTFGNAAELAVAVRNGASAVLLKDTPTRRLVATLRKVLAGSTVIPDSVLEQAAADDTVPNLTERQQEIVHSLTRGLSNADIAKQLGISSYRIQDHVNALLEKIGAANRVEAVAIALKKHLLKI